MPAERPSRQQAAGTPITADEQDLARYAAEPREAIRYGYRCRKRRYARGQKIREFTELRLSSRLRTMEIAASVRVAISVALSPRTIIARPFYVILMMPLQIGRPRLRMAYASQNSG